AASVTICWRRLGKNVPEPTRSAPARRCRRVGRQHRSRPGCWHEHWPDLARPRILSSAGTWFRRRVIGKKPSSKEGVMGATRTNRRELLKGGAALAGGVTLGELASSQAQAHDHPMTPGSPNASPMILGSKELVEYGQRSRYVTSVRIQHPPGG